MGTIPVAPNNLRTDSEGDKKMSGCGVKPVAPGSNKMERMYMPTLMEMINLTNVFGSRNPRVQTLFFQTDNTQYHILYATLFLCSAQVLILTKVVYYLAVIRNRTLRDLKRLELCMAEMNETLKSKG